MTSAAQVRRILALVPYLQQHPGVAVADVAKVFKVTTRQLRADLRIMWFVGVGPGMLIDVDMDAVESEGVIHLSNAGFLSRPMRFTLDEALSLIVALQTVRGLTTGDLADVVDSAIAKLRRISHTDDTGVQVVVSSGTERVRATLAEAIENGRAVRLEYDGASRGATTEPLADPVRLMTRAGIGYLQAWNNDVAEWRTYRLDRIAAVTVTDQPVGVHPAPPDEDFDWLEHGTAVTLLLDREARWVAEYYPVKSARDTPEGLRVEMSVIDPGWLDALLLRLGGSAAAIEPEPAASARRSAQDVLDCYAAAGLLDPIPGG